MLLAIDTSTNWASLALLDDAATIRATHSWEIGQQHSVQILGGIEQILTMGGARREDVTALAVATGPGSFNGVRVAVTVAKTLAFVWGVPLVGVPTLDGLAQSQPHGADAPHALLAVLEAGRDELYIGWYNLEKDARIVARSGEIVIATAAERGGFGAMIPPERPLLITGEMTVDHCHELERSFASRSTAAADVTCAVPLAAPDRAVGIGQIALDRLAQGQADDRLTLEPTYVRRPNITTSTRHIIPGTQSATAGNA